MPAQKRPIPRALQNPPLYFPPIGRFVKPFLPHRWTAFAANHRSLIPWGATNRKYGLRIWRDGVHYYCPVDQGRLLTIGNAASPLYFTKPPFLTPYTRFCPRPGLVRQTGREISCYFLIFFLKYAPRSCYTTHPKRPPAFRRQDKRYCSTDKCSYSSSSSNYRLVAAPCALFQVSHTNPTKKMRVDAWVSTFSITHYTVYYYQLAFIRG